MLIILFTGLGFFVTRRIILLHLLTEVVISDAHFDWRGGGGYRKHACDKEGVVESGREMLSGSSASLENFDWSIKICKKKCSVFTVNLSKRSTDQEKGSVIDEV